MFVCPEKLNSKFKSWSNGKFINEIVEILLLLTSTVYKLGKFRRFNDVRWFSFIFSSCMLGKFDNEIFVNIPHSDFIEYNCGKSWKLKFVTPSIWIWYKRGKFDKFKLQLSLMLKSRLVKFGKELRFRL